MSSGIKRQKLEQFNNTSKFEVKTFRNIFKNRYIFCRFWQLPFRISIYFFEFIGKWFTLEVIIEHLPGVDLSVLQTLIC
jgi:hypothetical protein